MNKNIYNKSIYSCNWNTFEKSITEVLNDRCYSVSFECVYRSVYNICNIEDSHKKGYYVCQFTKDLEILLKQNYKKLNSKNIKCINDILLYYTNKTGNVIQEPMKNLTIEI